MHVESSLIISYQAAADDEEEGSKRQPACPWPDAATVELIGIVGTRKMNGKFATMAATTEKRFARIAEMLNAALDDKSHAYTGPQCERKYKALQTQRNKVKADQNATGSAADGPNVFEFEEATMNEAAKAGATEAIKDVATTSFNKPFRDLPIAESFRELKVFAKNECERGQFSSGPKRFSIGFQF